MENAEKNKATGVTTRSKAASVVGINFQRATNNLGVKRKGEDSLRPMEKEKRAALGNLTNLNKLKKNEKEAPKGQTAPRLASNTTKHETENFQQPSKVPGVWQKQPVKLPSTKIPLREARKENRVDDKKPAIASSKRRSIKDGAVKSVRRLSTDFEKSENSLYLSSLEDVTLSASSSQSAKVLETVAEQSARTVPEGVEDFDKENWNDPHQVSEYADDIFRYMRERESLFVIADWASKQKQINKWMRSLLVDWMVEVQESFELNHETLYLAVKLVDLYLSKQIIDKDSLQLLGATAMLISSKYDERTPPMVQDFLYICDGAYSTKQLLSMEAKVLRTIDFDLGIPVSYRFLRRYARCAKVSMSILTLARYILELSLMEYQTITLSDSKMACAALFLALKMNKMPGWSKTLEYYSEYVVSDFKNIVVLLNDGLNKKPKEGLSTIRAKYSHAVFHEVAKVPVLRSDQLFVD